MHPEWDKAYTSIQAFACAMSFICLELTVVGCIIGKIVKSTCSVYIWKHLGYSISFILLEKVSFNILASASVWIDGSQTYGRITATEFTSPAT